MHFPFEELLVGSKDSIPEDEVAAEISNILAVMERMILTASSDGEHTGIAESPLIPAVAFRSLDDPENAPDNQSKDMDWVDHLQKFIAYSETDRIRYELNGVGVLSGDADCPVVLVVVLMDPVELGVVES